MNHEASPPTALTGLTTDGLPTDPLESRVTALVERITVAAERANRNPADVRIMFATKTQHAQTILAAAAAAKNLGIDVLLGENRVQEITAKAATFAELGTTAHLIGPLQSNKINRALDSLLTSASPGWVHSIDSITLAQSLGSRAFARGAELPVLVQVNVSGEETKSGVGVDNALDLATGVAQTPGLSLRGFMTIAARTHDSELVRQGFSTLRELRDALVATGDNGTQHATELSMGMSQDLELAIIEGATIIRIGTAIFGPR